MRPPPPGSCPVSCTQPAPGGTGLLPAVSWCLGPSLDISGDLVHLLVHLCCLAKHRHAAPQGLYRVSSTPTAPGTALGHAPGSAGAHWALWVAEQDQSILMTCPVPAPSMYSAVCTVCAWYCTTAPVLKNQIQLPQEIM